VNSDARVCPHCGEPPGAGVFCEACGRNLSAVERLPTRAQWDGEHGAASPPAPDDPQAVPRFLATMHAAGDPGVAKVPRREPGFLGRTQHAQGWIVRPTGSEHEPGLFLTVDGGLHRLESVTLGISNRGRRYIDVVGPETEAPVAADLATILQANGLPC
jgi:hypothetical protein